MSAEAELAALKAENARLKAEAEVAQLKAQMAQLAADNAALRSGARRSSALPAFGEPGYKPPPVVRDGPDPSRPQRKLIEFPVCEDAELDAAWEEMLTECLQDEGKRDALRETYYEQKDQEGKYYFFLEWASYLRKPEVMEQNSKNEMSVGFNTEDEGMRRRKGGSGGSDDVNSNAPQFADDDKYQKYANMRHGTMRKSASTSSTIFQYFLLVMAISVSLYLFRYFMGWGSPFSAPLSKVEVGDSVWDE